MGKDARHWGDRAAELAGATALGSGTAASGWLVAPLQGFVPVQMALATGFAGLIAGWLIVRLTPGGARTAALPPFEVAPIETLDEDVDSDELLLVSEGGPVRDSRVVELFDPPHPATPGDLQARIAAHLGEPSREFPASAPPASWDNSPTIPDASDALHAALADIRRSLRAG